MNKINREHIKFNKLFSEKYFENKKIAIIENKNIDCTNFLLFLSRKLNFEILSPYKNEIKNTEKKIIDDFFSAKLIFNLSVDKSTVAVFRADSFKRDEIFNFDMHIKISALKSGPSKFLTGEISIIDRENFQKEFYYFYDKKSIFFYEKF